MAFRWRTDDDLLFALYWPIQKQLVHFLLCKSVKEGDDFDGIEVALHIIKVIIRAWSITEYFFASK